VSFRESVEYGPLFFLLKVLQKSNSCIPLPYKTDGRLIAKATKSFVNPLDSSVLFAGGASRKSTTGFLF
jgi:hypothetical protein